MKNNNPQEMFSRRKTTKNSKQSSIMDIETNLIDRDYKNDILLDKTKDKHESVQNTKIKERFYS